ncbi:MAG: hypothetical protein LKI24_04055 [Acidipropionibacterium sp.]|nr:hypothetical protein [Acidipropionibacterium sp.]
MSKLESSVAKIMDYIGEMAEGYGGHVKWNEIAKLKADMMNVKRRWMNVDTAAFTMKCHEVGLTNEDTTEIVSLVKKVQQGRKLVPQRGYKTYRFTWEPESPADETFLRY